MMTVVQEAAVDLYAPFISDTLLEVRWGKMRPLKGINVLSGIDKSPCDDAVRITVDGIEGDEHDYTFHGGPDKAVHGYCCAHYPQWQQEFPAAAEAFQPGGFGENFVTARMNERNVCIGDVVAVGDEVVLQVSLPRQPCFKLNHRFQLKNFAPNTWRTSRTGWYYRVLHPGSVRAGDRIRLIERRHPKWTIERVQEYLHRNQNDIAANEELAAIAELGEESRGIFRSRAAKEKARLMKAASQLHDTEPKWRDYHVTQRIQQTSRIISIVLEAAQPQSDPENLSAGSHVRIKLGTDLVRAYSVVDGDRNKFELGIALNKNSRGGSSFIHEKIKVGDILQVGPMTSSVKPAGSASYHVFVAGGIGITAFLKLIEAVNSINYGCILHYAVRSWDEVPFKERLERLGDKVVLYDKQKGQRLDVAAVVASIPWNSHLYFCGPRRLMEEASEQVKRKGIPEEEVHFEAFVADTSGDPFEVTVANRDGGRRLRVGEEETLLDVLRKEFDDVPSSCEVGNCGTCKITLLEGRVEHRGTGLTQEERTSAMLSCVSRGIGCITVEI
ncbi:hypothetical protein VTK73DRAFT_9714 [Phialemonium thermophilum]|uniref:Uncharacterized protein n=1 Tax=Phialemonium thermophilum TaxID=223376 RepID=A0ABR3XJJ2_9PEZI